MPANSVDKAARHSSCFYRRMMLALLVCALCLLTGASGEALPSPGFDLLLLVRSYPPGFCSHQHCHTPASSSFTIHGLWPEYKTGGWPQFCGAHTTHQAAGPPTPAQNCLWPSLIGPSPGFWEHEWAKHGTCAAPLLGNRTAFVATVLELHEKYNLDVALGNAGVLPSSSGDYAAEDLQEAVRAAYGAAPLLSCTAGTLVEVWMCLDLELRVMDCPPAVRPGPKCGADVRLPRGAEVPPRCRPFSPPWGAALPGARKGGDGARDGGGGGGDGDDGGEQGDRPSWRVAAVLLLVLALAYVAMYGVQRLMAERVEAEEPLLLVGRGWQQGGRADP
ncbi:Ribonuclease DdI [Auxenochlorella protothecoides]|uniref:Ribonuclease DdI n=2 Tax=Auxenochlorella protothecoides TaxID=3075 RepID=A0A087SEV6_AUXPR|nr:Ribonuclease DdI [Auxenochlorella protothecoides]KFM24260.1 Ribonuclease DdI [Auxenochlorella protothecoides]RMZ56251.1 hypothetical protein APUTEX25_002441 [Auxenochlorella protothecoides]|eukprot:RMZ56251.1 hypothetical protein APUTEX25_002441 [Auxenochlorella protothecoides]